MRESFIFYRSFFDAICELDDKKRLKMYDAITNFALYDAEFENLSGICKQLFTLIKPQIIANNIKNEQYQQDIENGKKGAGYGKLGGRPKKKREEEKTPPGFLKNNPQENPINKNVNVNVNENVNSNIEGGFKKEKKIDKFSNPIFDDFLKAYKKAFNQNGFLSNAQRDKVIELYETIPDLKEHLPEVMQRLKDLKFQNIDFKPNLAWLLKNDNFYSVLSGEYEKQDDFADFLNEYRKEQADALT